MYVCRATSSTECIQFYQMILADVWLIKALNVDYLRCLDFVRWSWLQEAGEDLDLATDKNWLVSRNILMLNTI